jgi:uncharacterized protein (DUF885 family)
MSSRALLAALAAALLGACAAQAPAPAERPASVASAAAVQSEAQRLNALVEAYFEDQLKLRPMLATSIGDKRYNDQYPVSISPEFRAKAEQTERDYLARVQQIDPAQLAGQDLLSYQVFKSAREREIEGFRFPDHLIPLNQFYSAPNGFAQLGSGNGMQPFETVQDYENFLKRVDGFVAWTDQAIANMREGVQNGYTLPRVLG